MPHSLCTQFYIITIHRRVSVRWAAYSPKRGEKSPITMHTCTCTIQMIICTKWLLVTWVSCDPDHVTCGENPTGKHLLKSKWITTDDEEPDQQSHNSSQPRWNWDDATASSRFHPSYEPLGPIYQEMEPTRMEKPDHWWAERKKKTGETA